MMGPTDKRTDIDDAAEIEKRCFWPSKIVSGGQTGVDQGALDAAIQLGIAHGGWCPAGRISETGPIPDRYRLKENGVAAYPARTRQNVADSDATLILHDGVIGGGTRLTVRMCRQADKPYLSLAVSDKTFCTRVRRWLDQVQPATLNVAGTRESSSLGIQRQTATLLVACLGETA